MFKFFDCFDALSGPNIDLAVIEKHPGDALMLPFYYYDMIDKSGNIVGKISIRIGDNYNSYYNGHIGFEVRESFRGNNYSLHASKLVLRVAAAHGMERVYVTCAESNCASRKIIEKLNARLVEIAEIPKDCFFWRDGIEAYCIYALPLEKT